MVAVSYFYQSVYFGSDRFLSIDWTPRKTPRLIQVSQISEQKCLIVALQVYCNLFTSTDG